MSERYYKVLKRSRNIAEILITEKKNAGIKPVNRGKEVGVWK